MPSTNFLYSSGPGVYEVVNCGASKYVGFACAVNGSNQALWQVGSCTAQDGSGFVVVFELNTITGEVKINNVTLVVP